MSYLTIPLRKLAPPESSRTTLRQSGRVWLLTLDQIEKDTGRILNRQFTDADEVSASTHEFDSRHVLYSKLRPNLNKVVCPFEPGYATTELVRLLPDQKVILRMYLTHYLRSNYFVEFATRCVAGAKMPRMVMDQFWEHEIPIPSTTREQQRIVDILDQADDLRLKRQEANKIAARVCAQFFGAIFPLSEQTKAELSLDDVFDDVSRMGVRMQSKQFLKEGLYPIIDQGADEVAGFTNDASMLYTGPLPVILFGDHTRVFKYLDLPFCIGADGVRLLAPRSRFRAEFLFQQCLALTIPSAGYSRHFKHLRERLFFDSRPEQQARFARVFNASRAIFRRLNDSGNTLETLFQTLLQRAFDGRLTAKWREAHAKELLEEMQRKSRTESLPTVALSH